MKKKIKAIITTLLGKRKADRQKKAKPHEFIKWLKFANAGMLNNGNLYCRQYRFPLFNIPALANFSHLINSCGFAFF